jgi:KaiC/GvpD/RAD55 family RecA-like ATPase
MVAPTPEIAHFARQLVALEAAHEAGTEGPEGHWACKRLQQSLVRFVGTPGLRSLMSRALTMAKADVPSLGPVRVRPDGSFEGFGRHDDDEARVVVVARLLELLQTFIGRSLMLQLLRDAMMGGGIPEGDSLILAGPSGSGKSIVATQFLYEGLRCGEPGIVAIFEERPEEYLGRATGLGIDLQSAQEHDQLTVIYLRPLDLSVDETVREIIDRVAKTGAKRVVIDSLAGFELALAPGFREDFRESLYRMIGALTRTGVTIVSTVELPEDFTTLAMTPYSVSLLSDDIIRMRYVEINGELRKVLMIMKMRGGDHSKDIREYAITAEGLQVRDRLTGYHGLITGIPQPLPGAPRKKR